MPYTTVFMYKMYLIHSYGVRALIYVVDPLAAQSKILTAARLHYSFYLLKWFWSPLEIRISCKTISENTLILYWIGFK